MAFSTFLIDGISLAPDSEFHICICMHIFLQLTVSTYCTLSIAPQQSCKPAKVESFRALGLMLGFCYVVTAVVQD